MAALELDDRRVADVMRDAADLAIMPRWRALASGDVHAKPTSDDPDDLVTVADLEAEEIVTAGLHRILPGVAVVGEEAVAADPSLLDGIDGLPAYWLVDPVDGTRNFVDGSPDFGVMVALVEGGLVTASWIWLPVREVLASAVRGAGATLDDSRVDVPTGPARAPDDLRAWIASTYLPDSVAAQLRPSTSPRLTPPRSAAVGYVRMLEGHADGALYWRSHPWDHAPGSLLLEESGGCVRRLDGTPYLPGSQGYGLLAVRDARTWSSLRSLVFGDAEI